jgi:hypothetical protein
MGQTNSQELEISSDKKDDQSFHLETEEKHYSETVEDRMQNEANILWSVDFRQKFRSCSRKKLSWMFTTSI